MTLKRLGDSNAQAPGACEGKDTATVNVLSAQLDMLRIDNNETAVAEYSSAAIVTAYKGPNKSRCKWGNKKKKKSQQSKDARDTQQRQKHGKENAGSNRAQTKKNKKNHNKSKKKTVSTAVKQKTATANCSDTTPRAEPPRPGISIEHKQCKQVKSLELIGDSASSDLLQQLKHVCQAQGSIFPSIINRRYYRASFDDDPSSSSQYTLVVKESRTSNDNVVFSLTLDYSFQMPASQKRMLLDVFAKHRAVGFQDWLGGATGWRFDCPEGERVSWKRSIVVKLNSLQSVFTLYAPDDQKYFDEKKKRMVWRKQSELTMAVNDIRTWIEQIHASSPSSLTKRLFRNSKSGPDSLLHWAHHNPVSVCACLLWCAGISFFPFAYLSTRLVL